MYDGMMNRRAFLKILAQFGGAAFLGACSRELLASEMASQTPGAILSSTSTHTPNSSSTPKPISDPAVTPSVTASGEQTMGQVAFVKTSDRGDGVRRALDLLEVNPVRGKDLFLKPNFNSADPAPGSTHNDTLREMVLYLQEQGAERITVGDRSGMGDTDGVMRQKDVFRMAEELGFETVVFDHLDADGWLPIPANGGHWSRGFAVARPALESDGIIQACCLKTHRFGGHFTLSLKNSVGLVAKFIPGEGYNYMGELHGSAHQRHMIAEINTTYKPDLVVIDGVEAFVNAGPDQGKRVDSQVVLAGTDRVALDAVGVAILRYYGTTPDVSAGAIFEQEQIARAVELGLGVNSAAEIELITSDPESKAYADQISEVLLRG